MLRHFSGLAHSQIDREKFLKAQDCSALKPGLTAATPSRLAQAL
jgi:hypothetical protein